MRTTMLGFLPGYDQVTNTRLQTFRQCRRKHYNAYVLGVRRVPSEALRIGSAVHEGLHYLKSGVSLDKVLTWIDSNFIKLQDKVHSGIVKETVAVERIKTKAMVAGWSHRWKDSNLSVLASELPFEIRLSDSPIYGAEVGILCSGKIDAVLSLDGQTYIGEHKTTDKSLARDSAYWRHLRMDMQISTYWLAADALGYIVSGVIYDVIRKPVGGRKERRVFDEAGNAVIINVADGARAYKSNGKPRLSPDSGKGLAELRKPETDAELLRRYLEDMRARPDFYFARRVVPRLQSDLSVAQNEICQTTQDMFRAVQEGRNYKNTSACFSPFHCEYLATCPDDVDLTSPPYPDGFYRVHNVHPELNTEESCGKD